MTPYAATLLLASLLAPAAPAPKQDDAKALPGTWRGVTVEEQGKSSKAEGKKYLLVIEKGTLTLKEGSAVVVRGPLKLDPRSKPKRLDLTVAEGAGKGHAVLGIYERDGGVLKWCVNRPGLDKRPEGLSTKGTPHIFWTFKREK
jgi:uncharacterized protein (TIGR03067 family)